MAERFPQMFLSIAQGSSGTVVVACHVSRPGCNYSQRDMLWTMILHDEDTLVGERDVYEYLAGLLQHRAENYTQRRG